MLNIQRECYAVRNRKQGCCECSTSVNSLILLYVGTHHLHVFILVLLNWDKYGTKRSQI